MISRRLLLASLAGLSVSRAVEAAEPQVFSARGVAINGYDPVAYFTESRPVRGKSDFQITWKDATWMFASARNLAAFESDPTRHAPRYGGYCAYAVSRGYVARTDPAAWRIHDGRLYLNYSLNVRAIWSRDIPGNIARANANWPRVLSL